MRTFAYALMLFALAALATSVSALAPDAHINALHRRHAAARSNVVALGVGDVIGKISSKIDFKRGRVCETGAFGKQVCRKVSQKALGAYDNLDRDLAEVDDLPSFWILQAEEEFRREQQGGNPQLDRLE